MSSIVDASAIRRFGWSDLRRKAVYLRADCTGPVRVKEAWNDYISLIIQLFDQ